MMVGASTHDPHVAFRLMSMGVGVHAQEDLESYRRELTGYCYRMLGSGFEAEDAVQETLVRAWRNAGTFEHHSSVRSWIYRIATNVCIDMLRHTQRRARPIEMGPSSPPEESFLGRMLPECTWVTPLPDDRARPESSDPAELAQYRESIRLAFVTALQHLPPRQRAVLILCEVLRWQPAPSHCRGSRLMRTNANGCPAFGQYRPDRAGGHAPWALQGRRVLRRSDHRVELLLGRRGDLPRLRSAAASRLVVLKDR